MVEAEGSLPNLAGGWGLLGRKYAYLVLPAVLMPRGDFCPLGQVVWGLVGAKVRLPRPTNCANAPWWEMSLYHDTNSCLYPHSG